MINFIKNLVLILCLLVSFTAVSSENDKNNNQLAIEKLKELLIDKKNFSADFSQTTFSGNKKILHNSQGSLLIEKPNKFRWETDAPFHQLTVSNGYLVAFIDYDLEQVTQTKINKDIYATPAVLLSGNVDLIKETFKIELIKNQNVFEFILRPADVDNPIKTLTLKFRANKLAEMVINDALGQNSKILFSNISFTKMNNSQSFEIDVPDGFDLIASND